MVFLLTLAFAASSSCVQPFFCRSSRTRGPLTGTALLLMLRPHCESCDQAGLCTPPRRPENYPVAIIPGTGPVSDKLDALLRGRLINDVTKTQRFEHQAGGDPHGRAAGAHSDPSLLRGE